MHAGAYSPFEAKREREVLQLRVRRLDVGGQRQVFSDDAGYMKRGSR